MTTVQIIQTICKPLSDSPSVTDYIQIATESLNSRFFGKQFPMAVAYKACHLFTLCNESSLNQIKDLGNGEVASYSEGGISVSFRSGNSDSELSSTKYGKMLLALMKSIPTANVNRGFVGVCGGF